MVERGLTVWQPWAWAIVAGLKTVENRTQPTSFRGRLAIHAARAGSFDDSGLDFMADELDLAVPGRLPCGALVGEVTLVDCVAADDPRVAEDPWAASFADPWKWLLADAAEYPEPVPCRGQLGLWRVPSGLVSGG